MNIHEGNTGTFYLHRKMHLNLPSVVNYTIIYNVLILDDIKCISLFWRIMLSEMFVDNSNEIIDKIPLPNMTV